MSKFQVLKLYRTLIKLSNTWTASLPINTHVERHYIRDETRRLFKENKNLKQTQEINDAVREAEARLYMAQHYNNPYPRPVNFPPRSFARREGRKVGKAITKLNQMSKPIYLRSIDDENTKHVRCP